MLTTSPKISSGAAGLEAFATAASKAHAQSVELRARLGVQRPLLSAFCFRVFGTGEVPRHLKHHSNRTEPSLRAIAATASIASAT